MHCLAPGRPPGNAWVDRPSGRLNCPGAAVASGSKFGWGFRNWVPDRRPSRTQSATLSWALAAVAAGSRAHPSLSARGCSLSRARDGLSAVLICLYIDPE